jgi:uncharacterized membrane protein YdjX (TVP38/TMEM64 family)
VLVVFRLHSSLAAVPLVVIGALASAGGRYVLASTSRRFRPRMSAERIASLEAVRTALTVGRKRSVGLIGLFLLSPLPSAQLFIAAGLLAVPLVPLTAAFFAGRLVTYSIYVGAASAAKATLGSALETSLASPAGIALQLLMLAGLVALLRLDWVHILGPRTGGPRDPGVGSPSPRGHGPAD